MSTEQRWRRRAACGQMDPQAADVLFFGHWNGQGQRFKQSDVDRARAICEACPVLWDCLDDALRVPPWHDRDGIRAGLLPEERATLRDDVGVRPLPEHDHWTGGDPNGERRKRWDHRCVMTQP